MSGKSQLQTGSRVEQLSQSVFEMAADFVDPIDILDHAVRRVQSLHRLITRGADRSRDALIDGVVRVKRQYLSTGRIENQFAEQDAAQLLIFIQQPGNQLIDGRLCCAGAVMVGPTEHCAQAALTSRANQGMNLILPDSKWMRYSQQDQTPGRHLACRAISD